MKRTIIVFGIIAGLIVIGSSILTLVITGGGQPPHTLEWLGYLVMLIALSMIFVGIKRYRDANLGGVIRFGTAALVGVGIAAVAGVIYVVVWEVYLAMTDHTFIGDYAQGIVAAKRAEGVTGAELDALIASMEDMKIQYANPLYRLPMTFLEIFPVGLLIAVISAAILRNPRVLPAAS